MSFCAYWHNEWSTITSTKSPSVCGSSSASLTNLTVFLQQSLVCSCYVSRRILAPPPLILAHTTLRTLRNFDVSLGSLTIPAPEAGVFVELILLCPTPMGTMLPDNTVYLTVLIIFFGLMKPDVSLPRHYTQYWVRWIPPTCHTTFIKGPL